MRYSLLILLGLNISCTSMNKRMPNSTETPIHKSGEFVCNRDTAGVGAVLRKHCDVNRFFAIEGRTVCCIKK